MFADINTPKVGQRWVNTDIRTQDRGKTGKAKPKYREVEIVSLPTLSRPGVLRVVKAPRAPKTVGALREFTLLKLSAHYARIA